MYPNKYLKCFIAVLMSVAVSLSSFSQDKAAPKKEEKPPGEAEMMELAKPGENHKLLAEGVGNWTYTLKWWMDPSAAPSESSGIAVTKEVLGGRYFISEHTGKMMDMEFKGIATEGYDNVKKKFVSSWVDNMSTGIMLSEGTYDAASKTFTYRTEYEMMPGMKTKIRETIKITDQDHRTFEFYENRGGTEVKTMEINYTRKS